MGFSTRGELQFYAALREPITARFSLLFSQAATRFIWLCDHRHITLHLGACWPHHAHSTWQPNSSRSSSVFRRARSYKYHLIPSSLIQDSLFSSNIPLLLFSVELVLFRTRVDAHCEWAVNWMLWFFLIVVFSLPFPWKIPLIFVGGPSSRCSYLLRFSFFLLLIALV